jgi:hypothetical protein
VRRVDRLDPGSYESEISLGSRRLVEQASCESKRGQGIPCVVLARSAFVGGAFGVVFSGVCLFLVIECGYPLFRYPTVAPEPLCECGHSCRGSVSHELES